SMKDMLRKKVAPLLVALAAVAALLFGSAMAADAGIPPPNPIASDKAAKACLKYSSLRNKVVCIARSQIGVRERGTTKRKADNCQKYFRDFGSDLNCDDDDEGQWCTAFASWVWMKARVPNPPVTFRVREFAAALTKVKRPKPGDVAVIPNHHTEIVVQVDGDYVHTVSGNVGDSVVTGVHRLGARKYYRMGS
ncbi:CHAP domain-containing protein, partial [Dactylosporangium sp. NPDC050688]|uniref:CHAP domain-containing protein n=1 Tax=Dactylosporangium sp. NPDC050688 TaxID=3157217 RepID=UPI0033F46BD8